MLPFTLIIPSGPNPVQSLSSGEELYLLPTLGVDLRQPGLKRRQVGMVEFGGEWNGDKPHKLL